MHIEPGFIAPAKVLMANVGAVGVVAWAMKAHARELFLAPSASLKTLIATGFFSLFMQSFHMPGGPSELHFVGAMAMYLTLGFAPTLLGFALGLLVQGLLFEPADLIHLGVNALSLMLPLIAVHAFAGRKLFDRGMSERLTIGRILKLDAMYYGGVTAMVGFWLAIGEVQTPFTSWLAFAGSYLAIVACEPAITWLLLKGLKKVEGNTLVARLSVVPSLRLA